MRLIEYWERSNHNPGWFWYANNGSYSPSNQPEEMHRISCNANHGRPYFCNGQHILQ